ncbi:hypothetical protein EDD36DRAFT_458211 [Exophiala viscosa]|uniref:Uncharacterized protein n=1 Tax=Exophiala viscosa TaxID=2486360 RepID=A0AAN6DRB1_9EURO|nr:hypothetical protein EDD36DRAFT_458211 [Exophiala viscosa]
MLVRAFPKLLIVVLPLLFLGYFFSGYGHSRTSGEETTLPRLSRWLQQSQSSDSGESEQASLLADSRDIIHLPIPPPPIVDVDDDGRAVVDRSLYREVYSASSLNGEFIRIHFGGIPAYNPNIIPHPTKHDLWIIVAQEEQTHEPHHDVITELICDAGFLNGVLTCAEKPVPIPLKIHEPHCKGDMAYFNFALGSRDARVVYGPDAPYILYGSHSEMTCLGVWVQDLRVVLEDYVVESAIANLFREPAELHRPPPHKDLEKNFFLFWDHDHKLYVHHDISPRRVFAQVEMDGSVGPDLAPAAASTDEICMARYMPAFDKDHESIHQATNSLSITLCKRADPGCKPGPENTFIMHVFHFKSFYDWHGVYEPYVVLFNQQAPFALHAISKKPFWIHGRDVLSEMTGAISWENKEKPARHSEMFYITSLSWKTHGQRYHGYIDDELFISFGIEDSRPGVMDVIAGDLLQDLGMCGELLDRTTKAEVKS